MKKFSLFAVLVAAAALTACGTKPVDDPVLPAPTAITLNPASLTAAPEGETLTVEITSPYRPNVTDLPGCRLQGLQDDGQFCGGRQ